MAVNIQHFNPDSLVTAPPYHIPGYGGYTPQRKYMIGGTFSKTTHEILTDAKIGSGNLVLQKIEPVKEKIPREKSKLIPGYTGYISKGEHYFGLPYVTACSYAKGDHKDAISHQASERLRMAVERGKAVPLTPIRRSAKPYVSRRSSSKSTRLDYHISGYTCFLPMSRNKIGMGYPSMTKQAIADYRAKEREQAATQDLPFQLERTTRKKEISRMVYPKTSGMVPHYTGHVPGEKFKYGDTFGISTNAALKTMYAATDRMPAV